jgi:hypothetical protein
LAAEVAASGLAGNQDTHMLNELTVADFTPRLGQTFRIALAGLAPIDLELVSATELSPASQAQPQERRPFSLIFLGPESDQYLLQHIYRLEHPQMGALDLFLVPLGLQAQRMQYEAIFA